MVLQVPQQRANLFKEGKNLRGVDEVLISNIESVCKLSNVLRTSFGPNGRKKIIVNHLERHFLTSDAATIIKELDVAHPAAKLLVMATKAQESEMGDGTNLVAILTGELLKKAESLLQSGIHPSDIVLGYEHALEQCLSLLESLVVYKVNDFHVDEIQKVIAPVLSAKQLDFNVFLALNIAPAIQMVMPRNPKEFNVDSVRVVKVLGGSVFSSTVVKGMVFNREPEGSVKLLRNARVAVFTCELDILHTEAKGTVLLKSANELLNFSSGEEQKIEKLFLALKEKVDAIVCGGAVGTLALHFCNRFGIMVVKVPSKFDLRRLCRVLGSTALLKVVVPTVEELGRCDVIETIEIGSDRCVCFRQESDSTKTSTIVVRGATMGVLDDVERAIDDAVNSIKALTKDQRLVAGAGATELELARLMQEIATKTPGLNQYAMMKFADVLESIPRLLAENAGLDPTEILSQMYSSHEAGNIYNGVVPREEEDGLNGSAHSLSVADVRDYGIYDLYCTKQWAIKLAMDAALTVLRVDQMIMKKPAGGPKPRENKDWDQD